MDTLRDLQALLVDSLPGFEFPRCDLSDYVIDVEIKKRSEIEDGDFIFGLIWHEIEDRTYDSIDALVSGDEDPSGEDELLVDKSTFNFILTPEEINIIAILMLEGWVQRQVTSIENTRMKYSGSDFKMTSQANHLQKLIALLEQTHKQSHHMQRLYKRRRHISSTNNQYRANWDVFGKGVYYDRAPK